MTGTNRKNQWSKAGKTFTLAILLSAGFAAQGQAAAKKTERVSRARAPVEIERPCRDGEEFGRVKGRPCRNASPRALPARPIW